MALRSVLKEYSLLYAEDEHDVQQNMAEFFRTYFREVYVASDGDEALQLYERHQPDAVLLDINMPGTDGITLAGTLLKQAPHLPVAIISAHSENSIVSEAWMSDIMTYLIKPVTPFAMKKMLDRMGMTLSDLQPES